MLVVDAGVLVDLLLDASGAAEIRRRLMAHRGELGVPAHADMEVMNVLRSLRRARRLDRDQADALVSDLLTLAAKRYPLTELAPRMWQLADNMTPYDAAYVALAERLDAPLLTGDQRLARAAAEHTELDIAVLRA